MSVYSIYIWRSRVGSMGELSTGKRIAVIVVGAVLASFVIIAFLNWEAHRRYDRMNRDDSLMILKEHNQNETSKSITFTLIQGKLSHFIFDIKSKLKKKLIAYLQDEEKMESPPEIPEENKLSRSKRSVSSEEDHSSEHVKLQQYLLHKGILKKKIGHLGARVHKLHRDSPLVKEILHQFGHGCHHKHHHHTKNLTHHHRHHHATNSNNSNHHVNVSIKLDTHPGHSSPHHIIPQTSPVDLTHPSDKFKNLIGGVCGSSGDVILIIISTTLINWTLLIIALVIRAIFLQRDLLCSESEEEDTLPISEPHDQYRPLYPNTNDSIIIKPNPGKV